MEIPDHLICLLRNLYAGQEATEQWTGSKFRKEYVKYIIICLFNLYAEYIMKNAGLENSQAGIKIARRKISSFRYADDNTLMAESKEELKSLLIKVKERVKKLV